MVNRITNKDHIQSSFLTKSALARSVKKAVISIGIANTLAWSSNAAIVDDVVKSQIVTGSDSVTVSHPSEFTGDIRELNAKDKWQPGDAIKVANPRRYNDPENLLPAVNPVYSDTSLVKKQRAVTKKSNDTTIGVNKVGFEFTGAMPPDPTGDVGEDYYISAVNGNGGSAVSIIKKEDGVQVGETFSMASLATSGNCTTGLGDPIIIYDEVAKRWLLTEFSDGSNHLCVHISKTSDPVSGGWFTYEFEAPAFPDYPKYAVWGGNYFVSANESGGALYALDRSKMLNGEPATMVRKTIPGLAGFGFQSITPVDPDGKNQPADGTPGLFIRQRDDEKHNSGSNDGTKDFLELWALTPDFASPDNTILEGPINIDISELDSDFICDSESFGCLTQKGDSQTVDPLKEVVNYKAQYRKFDSHEAIVGNFISKTGENTAALRWFELRKTGDAWALHQEGQLDSSDNNNRYMAGSALDGSGNLALAYMTTGADRYPSIAMSGRKFYDANGTISQDEKFIVEGDSFIGSDRDGDYSQMAVDPVDNCTFWYTAEYGANNGQWKVQVANFKYNDCTGVVDPNPGFTLSGTNLTQEVCKAGELKPMVITPTPYNGFNKSIDLTYQNLPDNLSGSFSVNPVPANANSNATITVAQNTPEGKYAFGILGKSTDARDSELTAKVQVVDGTHTASLQSPENNAEKLGFQPTLQWSTDGFVTTAKVEIATDNAFNNVVATGAVSGGTSYRPSQPLAQETKYFWRVTAANSCGEVVSDTFDFTTKNPKDDYTLLTNGESKSFSISQDRANEIFYIEVPEEAIQLKINTTGGVDGDADIYVQYDRVSEHSEDFICKGITDGSTEECVISQDEIKAGTWYIRTRAWSAFSNLSIVATHSSNTNATPVALSDTVIVNQDTTGHVIDALANDSDEDEGDSLTLVSVVTSAGGTATIVDNKINYSPKAGYSGEEVITYIIKDTKDAQAQSTVTVTVNAIPVAVADSRTVQEGSSAVLINVLSNDTDADAGDVLTLVSVTASAGGSASVSANNVSYAPKAKFSGTEVLTYKIMDSNGAEATGKLTITVTAKPKSGGSMPLTMLVLLPIFVFRRLFKR